MRKPLLILWVAIIATCNTIAQTSYPSSDFGVAGDSLLYTKVTLSVSQVYYFYQAGANQVWNYSSFSPTSQYSQEYLNPTTAGYRATYLADCEAAGGTLTTCRNEFTALTNLALPTNQDQTISSYTFTDITDMDLLTAGWLETDIIGFKSRLNGVTVPFTTQLSSPDVVYTFPLTYGARDSSVSGYNIDLTSQGIDFVYHAHSKRVNHDDAWGSITTPYATYPSTIRQRSTILHTDTLFYDGSVLPIAPTTQVTYSWFATTETGPVFVAHGTIAASGQEYYTEIDYLDTIHCLTPVARENSVPILPTIGASGNTTVTFNNTSTNANSYTWTYGDPGSGANNTSTGENGSHTYTNTGTYSCELIACNTVCSPERCDTDNFTINVVDSGQVVAAFIAIPSVTCVGDSVEFRDNSVNASSYSWNFGDNTTSNIKTPTHAYTAAGTYNVTLIASGGGLSDTITRTVTIQPPAAAVITPNGPVNFCNGDSVILAASGGTVYHWSTGSVNDQITVRTSGTYTLTAQNTCGTAVSTPITVTVTRPVDTITAAGPLTFCSGDSVLLQANTGSGLVYQWRKNGQLIIDATQSTYEASTSGAYTVNVTENGCRGLSNAIAVTVNTTPDPIVTVTGSTTICAGDSLRLTATLDTSNTYQWKLNGVNIPGANSHIYYAKVTGTFTVLESRSGCSATSNGIAVTVNPAPAPAIVTSGSNAVCQGDSLLLTTQSGSGYSYQWLLGGVAISGATSQTYYAKTAGAYSVTITSLGCSGTSSTQSVIVNTPPTASAGSGTILAGCNAPSATIGGNPSASGSTGPYHYLWSPSSSLSSDTVADPTVSHLGATQVYTLVVTDANGCTASSSTTVIVTGSNVTISLALTGDSAWCFGTPDTLLMAAAASGTSGSVSYSWTPATDLSAPTSATTQAFPTAVGSYTYNIVATDSLNCQAGTSVTIHIYPQPVATITATDTTAPCAGDSTDFTAGIGAGYSYQWLNGGSAISGATNINFATGSAGSYAVSVTEGICSATSNAVPVTIRPMPTASIVTHGSLTFCAGVGVGLQATGGAGYNYTWYENGQLIAGDTAISIVAMDSGTYYAVVTENGCSATSNSYTTNVIQNPEDSIAASGLTTFCVGNTVQLFASQGAGYTYVWQNNGNNINGQTGDSLTVDSTGIYDVVVTSQGCSETSLAIPVTVFYYPDDIITASGAITFCGGDSVTLTASSGPGYTYQWQIDGTPISNGVGISYTTMDSGLYNVVVTQNGCTDSSSGIYVTVLPLPAAAGYISSASGLVCPGDSFYVYVASNPGSAFQWQLNGSNITGATADTFYTNITGTYDVIVAGGGCVGESNLLAVGNYTVNTPTISDATGVLTASAGISFQWYADSVAIPGANSQTFSPPSGGIYSVQVTDSNGCTQMSAPFSNTGIQNMASFAQASVYPNPATESLAVALSLPSSAVISITLYDIIGNEVAEMFKGTETAGNHVHQVSVTDLASGIYLVKISDGSSTIVRRISIEH